MGNNQDLTPTTITDKNGKITTVHKKQPTNNAATPMPTPSLPHHLTMSQMQTAVTERITELYDLTHESGFDYRPYLAKEIRTYSEQTLSTLELALQNDSDLAHGVATHIVHGENNSFVKEVIHYYRVTESEDYWKTSAEVRALGHYTAVNTHADLIAVDETTEKSCLALIKFARLIDTLPEAPSPYLDYIDGDNYDSRVINNDDLATLIANRPDDAERIAEIVLKYETMDIGIINGLLEGALPALADGHL